MRNYRFSLDIFPFLKRIIVCLAPLAFTPTIAAHIQHRLGSGDSGDLAAWQLGWLQVLAAARDIVVASIQVVHLHSLSFLYSYYIPPFIHFFIQVVHHFHSLSFTLYCFSLFHPPCIYHFGQTKAALPSENDPDLETSQATSAIRLFLYKVL